MIAARIQKCLGHRGFALVVVGLIGVVRALIPDGHTIREGGTFPVLLLLCHSEVVGHGIQHISFRGHCLGQAVDGVIRHGLLACFSEGQGSVLAGGAGQGKAVRCWGKRTVSIGSLHQCERRAGKSLAGIVLIQFFDCYTGRSVRTSGAARRIMEFFDLNAAAAWGGIAFPMGVVGNGDGLTRRGVDCGFIGNGQRQVVRQNNFQRLSFHGGGPVRYHLACLGVHHLNGSGVQNQGIAQIVHQGDGIRPADQILAQLIQRDLKGIPAAIGFGVISALLGQRLFSDCHTIAVVADGRSLGILQADHIVELLAHAAQKNVRIRYLTDDLYLHGIIVPVSASGYQIVNIPDHLLTVGVIVVRLASRVVAEQGLRVFRPAAA